MTEPEGTTTTTNNNETSVTEPEGTTTTTNNNETSVTEPEGTTTTTNNNETSVTEPEGTTTTTNNNETSVTEPEGTTTTTTTTTTTNTRANTTAPDDAQYMKPATVIVQSSITNDCKPPIFCDDINVNTFLTNVSTSEGKDIQIPQSIQGWAVYLFPESDGLQYFVSQATNTELSQLISLNTTFSEECRGLIKPGDVRHCKIINELNGNNIPARLKVITKVENNCNPKSDCTHIDSGDFMAKIVVFEQNAMRQKVKPFPGDKDGWTVYFLPEQLPGTQWPPYGEGIQYKVEQETSPIEGLIANTTYSHDCRSVIDKGFLKNCTITNSFVGLTP